MADQAKKITSPIVGYEVAGKDEQQSSEPKVESLLGRQDALEGRTYKIKEGHMEKALYVTINDTIHENGKRIPFEMFVNCKNMEDFAWVTALTRIISAIFRHGGDVEFVAQELKEIFDPRGGFFCKPRKKGEKGIFAPSVVALIGIALDEHFQLLRQLNGAGAQAPEPSVIKLAPEVKVNGKQCSKCHQFDVVRMDGCDTCMSCGDSKCG